MAYDLPAVVVAGETATAAWANKVRSSLAATAVATVTTEGDTVYASAANTLARLAHGAEGTVLRMGAAIPAWNATVPSTYEHLAHKTAGYIMQWHVESAIHGASGDYTLVINFSEAFPTDCDSVVVTPLCGAASSAADLHLTAKAVDHIDIAYHATAADTYYFMVLAIGH
jgi:hypothetical protein